MFHKYKVITRMDDKSVLEKLLNTMGAGGYMLVDVIYTSYRHAEFTADIDDIQGHMTLIFKDDDRIEWLADDPGRIKAQEME